MKGNTLRKGDTADARSHASRSSGARIGRRTALAGIASSLAAAGLRADTRAEPPAQAGASAAGRRRVRKIATEEAWTIPEVAEGLRAVVRRGGRNLDLLLLEGIYDPAPGTPPRFLPQLLDVEKERQSATLTVTMRKAHPKRLSVVGIVSTLDSRSSLWPLAVVSR